MQNVNWWILGRGVGLVLYFKEECGFTFKVILKELHKYVLIGLLFLTIVMNFICILGYILGPYRDIISRFLPDS